MPAGRPKSYVVTLNDEQRTQLESFARSRSLPTALARRAKIILMAADDMINSAIAEKLEVSNPTIADWCRRYIADGIRGLCDLPPGHPRRTYEDDDVAQLMQQALDRRPVDATHRSTRTFARETQVSKSTRHRAWGSRRSGAPSRGDGSNSSVK